MKLKIISEHTKYKKGQIIDIDEKDAIQLLTNGKALRVRKIEDTKKPKKNV